MDRLSFLLSRWAGVVFRTASVQQTENRGNKYQCGNRGGEKAADDRAAQRSVLFASVAKAKGHRDHADDHGQCRHDDRAKTRVSRLNCRLDGITVMQET